MESILSFDKPLTRLVPGREHLGIALALNVPVMVVITKIDICPPQILQQTIIQLTRILKSPGARKIPIFIKNREDTINTATQFISQRICPVFQVSNVTGESLDLVRIFLNILPHHGYYDVEAPFEFHVNDTFSVPFVGTVVSGVVKSGMDSPIPIMKSLLFKFPRCYTSRRHHSHWTRLAWSIHDYDN